MFIAHVIQKGEGCDYTIGCGLALWKLESDTYKEAVKELRKIVIGKWNSEEDGYREEFELEEVTLFEVINEEKMPIDKWYSEANAYEDEQLRMKYERKERAELERLKSKFEKKEEG